MQIAKVYVDGQPNIHVVFPGSLDAFLLTPEQGIEAGMDYFIKIDGPECLEGVRLFDHAAQTLFEEEA